MKKKIDAMTVISIVLIVINLMICGPRIVNRGNILNGGPLTLITLLRTINYLWCLILIIYPIIKYFELNVKLIHAQKKQETEKFEEYEVKKKKSNFTVKRNIILAILLFMIDSLFKLT